MIAMASGSCSGTRHPRQGWRHRVGTGGRPSGIRFGAIEGRAPKAVIGWLAAETGRGIGRPRSGPIPCPRPLMRHVTGGMIDTWADTTFHPTSGKRIQVWL